MPGHRFTIRSMMIGIATASLAFAALARPSSPLAAAVFALTTSLLALAVPCALLLRGRRRAFCLGFAAIGWAHLILCYSPTVRRNPEYMPTLYSIETVGWYLRAFDVVRSKDDVLPLEQTWIALATLLLAALGGLAAVRFRGSGSPRDCPQEPTPGKRSVARLAARCSVAAVTIVVLMTTLQVLRGGIIVMIGTSRLPSANVVPGSVLVIIETWRPWELETGPDGVIACGPDGCHRIITGWHMTVGPATVHF